MATPPPPPAPDELALASAIVSHVNAGLEFIDDLVRLLLSLHFVGYA
jgi:hypothetical protein